MSFVIAMALGGKSSEVCVVGSEYCNRKAVELAVVMGLKQESFNFVGVGREENIVFKIEDTTSAYGAHKKRVLLDGNGAQVLTFRHKAMSLHSRWRVYKGNSEGKKDLIFSAKQSSIVGSNKELKVFLVSNKDEKTCDFRVASSGIVYVGGDITNNVAEIMCDGAVKVYPKVDQAFIISLSVIFHGMKQQSEKREKVAKIVGQGAVTLGANIALGLIVDK